MRQPRIGLAVVGALLLVGCADDPDVSAAPGSVASPTATATATPTATSAPTESAVDPASVAANELGRVPVLMVHQVIAAPRRVYDQTPAQFRAMLEMLYDEDYRPITAADLVTGEIDIPAGTHPVVLTLDDSTISQAQIGPDGQPDPDTALGILAAFGEEHPAFTPTGTYYVNTFPEPFVDAAVLPWLAANGYEIGAHTHSHADLSELSDAGVQEEIGRNIAGIEASVPGYQVTTLAIPFGARPGNAVLAHTGSFEGAPYELAGVMAVSNVAAASPYTNSFDRFAVPRTESTLGVTEAALEFLRENPSKRYTSDGDPERVSFPIALADELDEAWAERAQPY